MNTRVLLLVVAVVGFACIWTGDNHGSPPSAAIDTATVNDTSADRPEPDAAQGVPAASADRSRRAVDRNSQRVASVTGNCLPESLPRHHSKCTVDFAIRRGSTRTPSPSVRESAKLADSHTTAARIAAANWKLKRDAGAVAAAQMLPPIGAEPDGFALVNRCTRAAIAAGASTVRAEGQAADSASESVSSRPCSFASDEIPFRTQWMFAGCDLPLPLDIAPGLYRVVDRAGTVHDIELTPRDLRLSNIPPNVPPYSVYILRMGDRRWSFFRVGGPKSRLRIAGANDR